MLKIESPDDLAIPRLGIRLREMKTYTHAELSMNVTAALFIIAQKMNGHNHVHPNAVRRSG